MLITEDVRRDLVLRSRSRRTRTTIFSASAPTEWQPYTLRDPREPDRYFTEETAWEYVGDALEGGISVETVILKKPPGKTGYVLKLSSHAASVPIYVKLQLGADKVIGRSFHEDKPGRSG